MRNTTCFRVLMCDVNSGQWIDYCYNRVEIDSARPMFRKESNTRMRSSESHCHHAQAGHRGFRASPAFASLGPRLSAKRFLS